MSGAVSKCQPHEGPIRHGGYGYVTMDGRKYYAHRLAWALCNGEDPGSRVVRHTCDNPICINPEHLVIGTHRDNMDDMMRRGRQQRERGERNARAVLTEQDVRGIRCLHALGCGSYEIAKIFNITPPHARNVAMRRIWGWLQ